ncbi:membrane protein insertase YidC [Streptomyces sp. 549]|uniref:YidC/Oxa1 family membrane protein insertase n=1 Tax=Streptomyces sp. 549 TaxID=3049076 RepID=UPI0024C3085F|nr:membrane protein insertase YidC [Streptomyces sp. 549]MDK1472064.1 membrane protein insertase YidC [Streptomyces sp. 549]
MSVLDSLSALLTHLSDLLRPLFGGSATAAAVVAMTLAVRLLLHPLARAAARGERARAALAPQLAKIHDRHRGDPQRIQRATAALYAESGSSPLAGCLPTLLQLPVFLVLYQLFTRDGSELLDHTLLGAPLGDGFAAALADGGLLGPAGLVHLALFAVLAAVGTWSFLQARRRARLTGTQPQGVLRLLPLLSYGTMVTAAVVPLAAGLYLATSTAWTTAERALLL